MHISHFYPHHNSHHVYFPYLFLGVFHRCNCFLSLIKRILFQWVWVKCKHDRHPCFIKKPTKSKSKQLCCSKLKTKNKKLLDIKECIICLLIYPGMCFFQKILLLLLLLFIFYQGKKFEMSYCGLFGIGGRLLSTEECNVDLKSIIFQK